MTKPGFGMMFALHQHLAGEGDDNVIFIEDGNAAGIAKLSDGH